MDEIIDRERKGAIGFTDYRRCLFTYGDFRRLLMEIEAAWERERENAAANKHRRTKTYDPAKQLQEYWRDNYEV